VPTVWVDADACPRAVKDVLFRASERIGLEVVLVANRTLAVPQQGNVRSVQVKQGFDVADEWIDEQVTEGDLVITSDIALQVSVLEAGATVIDFRGDEVSLSAARSKLRLKDLLEDLRQAGEIGGGPKARSAKDTKRFAEGLDRWLQRLRTA
jgi:uncharacterized protein YaiI (UPF0178 family)